MKTKFTMICTSFVLFFALTLSAYAQQISGTVTDESGVPLPGATVLVEGTSNGVSTDFDGNYSINASQGDVLVFSYVGYSSQSITVGSSSTVNVNLEPDNALDEVVVTALGLTREKKSLGYSVSELSGSEVNTVKNHNLASSLSGKVAGLNITSAGSTGAGSRIVIRGNNSLTGNTQALIVVDGVPINADGTNSGGSVYNNAITGGGITDINPSDVESISVLKGPNAAALYGSRAGNGVILITTKKGSSESKMGVTINSNTVIENVMQMTDFQNTYGQGTLGAAGLSTSTSWGQKMDGSLQPYFTGVDKAYTAQPNNVYDFFRTGVQSINSIAVENGNYESNIRFSYTNNSTESVLPNSTLDSHNFNLRASTQLSDRLSVDAKATYFTQDLQARARTGGEGEMRYIFTMPRNVDHNDLKKYQMDNPSSDADFAVISESKGVNRGNPYWMLENDIDEERRGRFLGFAKVNYEFTDWLSGFVRVSSDITNVDTYRVEMPGHHFYPQGRIEKTNRQSRELNSEFLLTAKGDLADNLNAVLNVGGNLSKRTFESIVNRGDDFKLNTKHFLANTQTQTVSESPQQIKKVNSLYGNLNLAYDNFAYLDITARNDWSSTLGADNRSYLYTSASLSLLLEDFIDPDNVLFDLFKVRGSFADVGNDTSAYQLVQTFSVPGQGYLGLTTLNAPSTRLNPDLKPENVQSTEFGLELSMLDNRLSFDLSIYDITTTDLIFRVPVPAATGYSFFLENIGEVNNKGVELSLGYDVVNSDSFSWSTRVFASKNENKLISLVDDLEELVYVTSNSGNLITKATVGGGIGDLYGTVWEKDDAGNHKVTANGTHVASTPTNFLGNAQPDWLAGWNNTFFFGDFALNVLIDGRFGGVIYSADSSLYDSSGVSQRSLQYREGGVTLTGVDPNGATNTTSITGQEYWGSYSAIAENYVYSQDNVRLRELSLGYNVPNVSSLGLSSLNISVIGRNLFFFNKKAEDIDPEAMLGTNIGGMGYASSNLPTLRSMGLNVTLKF